MNIVEFYKTQMKVLWNWKGGPLALIWRFVLTILVATVSLILTAWLLPSLHLAGLEQPHDRVPNGGRQRVAAEGRAMVAGVEHSEHLS